MLKKLLITFFALSLTLTLTGCSENNTITNTGAGTTVMGDGGENSAQFAGTYKGTLNVTYSGSSVPKRSDEVDVTLIVAKDGTVKMTGKDIAVEGVINANKVFIDIKIVHKEPGLSCDGTAEIRSTVNGNKITGPITGGAECKVLAVDTKKATLTGTMTVTKQ